MTATTPKRQEMVTVPSIAARLAISRSKVYMMIESGELPAFRFGHCLRVMIADLNTYVERCRYDVGI